MLPFCTTLTADEIAVGFELKPAVISQTRHAQVPLFTIVGGEGIIAKYDNNGMPFYALYHPFDAKYEIFELTTVLPPNKALQNAVAEFIEVSKNETTIRVR